MKMGTENRKIRCQNLRGAMAAKRPATTALGKNIVTAYFDKKDDFGDLLIRHETYFGNFLNRVSIMPLCDFKKNAISAAHTARCGNDIFFVDNHLGWQRRKHEAYDT